MGFQREREFSQLNEIELKFQYFSNPTYDTTIYRELEEKYYRGLCAPVSNYNRDKYFCKVSSINFILSIYISNSFSSNRIPSYYPLLRQLLWPLSFS